MYTSTYIIIVLPVYKFEKKKVPMTINDTTAVYIRLVKQ